MMGILLDIDCWFVALHIDRSIVSCFSITDNITYPAGLGDTHLISMSASLFSIRRGKMGK